MAEEPRRIFHKIDITCLLISKSLPFQERFCVLCRPDQAISSSDKLTLQIILAHSPVLSIIFFPARKPSKVPEDSPVSGMGNTAEPLRKPFKKKLPRCQNLHFCPGFSLPGRIFSLLAQSNHPLLHLSNVPSDMLRLILRPFHHLQKRKIQKLRQGLLFRPYPVESGGIPLPPEAFCPPGKNIAPPP